MSSENRSNDSPKSANPEPPRPWYREPWVWMLWAVPGSAVVVGSAMLAVSISTYDGLVADDYYKQGKHISRVLDRDRRAGDLGLRAALEIEAGRGQVRVTLRADTGVLRASGSAPKLVFSHATRGGVDKEVTLDQRGDGQYLGILPPLEAGRWYLTLGDADWRLTGVMNAPTEAIARVEMVSRAPAS